MTRSIASQLGIGAAGALVALGLTGGGLAFAQQAPESGSGVAEAIAGANTVNSAAIINNSVARTDMRLGTIPLWARIASDGTIIASKGVTGASAGPSSGEYLIDFSRDITACAWLATATDNDSGARPPGYATVERKVADVDTLKVRTYDFSGLQTFPFANDGFTILVSC